ncbi:MAG: CapA family protein [Acetatifactor sp.]|nr:CapA family protein [Acetatifactor sp.]
MKKQLRGMLGGIAAAVVLAAVILGLWYVAARPMPAMPQQSPQGKGAEEPAGSDTLPLKEGSCREPSYDPGQEMQSTAQEPDDSRDDSRSELTEPFDFTLCFAGDINLDENWDTTLFLEEQPEGIYDCISAELVEAMQAADVMCLNNEFTYSTGGSPLPGKAYTFRADPERVEVLRQLGVDVVTLANNHVYDYGKEALLDTFAVLEQAGVPYFGAGRTLEDAMAPLYLEVEGKTIALVAASRAEKNKMTPQATDTEPGILRCYDTELFLQAIREGKENADFCIAFVHWGTEYSFELEQVQKDTGKAYLDAGADAVIGAHSHCLQGMEFYDGKPIIYSLGNYWFNKKTLDTMLLQLHFSGDDAGTELTVQVIPAVQSGCRTVYAAEETEQRRIFEFLESISVNVEIGEDGTVTERHDQGP